MKKISSEFLCQSQFPSQHHQVGTVFFSDISGMGRRRRRRRRRKSLNLLKWKNRRPPLERRRGERLRGMKRGGEG